MYTHIKKSCYTLHIYYIYIIFVCSKIMKTRENIYNRKCEQRDENFLKNQKAVLFKRPQFRITISPMNSRAHSICNRKES